jgi:hypothetical protein
MSRDEVINMIATSKNKIVEVLVYARKYYYAWAYE